MTRNQEIRHECLLQLYGSQSIPISPTHIRKVTRREGSDYTETEIGNALYFLVGQGLVERLQCPATGEPRYRITSRGMLHYESVDPAPDAA
jgi:hypothetical protein